MAFDWRQIPEQDRHLLPTSVDIRADLGYVGIRHGYGFIVKTSEPEAYLNQFFLNLVWMWVEEARRIYGDATSIEYIVKALHQAYLAASGRAAEKAHPDLEARRLTHRADGIESRDPDDGGGDPLPEEASP
jgi:hypothetical protein